MTLDVKAIELIPIGNVELVQGSEQWMTAYLNPSNNQYYFLGVEAAKALDPDSSNHSRDVQNFLRSKKGQACIELELIMNTKIEYANKIREMVVFQEQALYMFFQYSNKDIAIEFCLNVARQLQELRETGAIVRDDVKTQLEQILGEPFNPKNAIHVYQLSLLREMKAVGLVRGLERRTNNRLMRIENEVTTVKGDFKEIKRTVTTIQDTLDKRIYIDEDVLSPLETKKQALLDLAEEMPYYSDMDLGQIAKKYWWIVAQSCGASKKAKIRASKGQLALEVADVLVEKTRTGEIDLHDSYSSILAFVQNQLNLRRERA